MAIAKCDASRALADLNKFERVLPDAALNAMLKTAQFASLFVTKYLHGPRPMFLQSVSNTLRTHIGYTAELHGRDVYGYIGTNAKSPTGFNYPEYWEVDGRGGATVTQQRKSVVSDKWGRTRITYRTHQFTFQHKGPRPFLTPAVMNHKTEISSKFNELFGKELKKLMKGRSK